MNDKNTWTIAAVLGALLMWASASVLAADAPAIKQIILGERPIVRQQPSGQGSYRIQLVNVLPGATYEIRGQLNKIEDTVDPLPGIGTLALDADACATADERLQTALAGATSEDDVATLRNTFRAQLTQATCTAARIEEFARFLDDKTTMTSNTVFVVGEDVDLAVSVKRLELTTEQGKKFAERDFGSYEFAATRKGKNEWLVLYGFNYVKNGDDTFFTQASTTTPTTYTITPTHDRRNRDFAASVYFMWVPEHSSGLSSIAGWHKGDQLFGGISAGLGFDLDAPTAYIGYGVGWGSNVMVTAGVAYHQEQRLAGRYDSGDVVAEDLTSEQLTEKTYKPRAYVGFAFRFGENPWKKSQ